MLGDNSEKSKNPLKKAMRRRNAKTVSFSNPTYIEASDAEFVTEDEMEEGDFFDHDEESSRGDEDDDGQDGQHEDMVVEPLKPKAQREKETREPEAVQPESTEPGHVSLEKSRTSEDAESDGKTLSFVSMAQTGIANFYASRECQQVQKWHRAKYRFILQR